MVKYKLHTFWIVADRSGVLYAVKPSDISASNSAFWVWSSKTTAVV